MTASKKPKPLSVRFRDHIKCHCPDERCSGLLAELRALEKRCATLEARAALEAK